MQGQWCSECKTWTSAWLLMIPLLPPWSRHWVLPFKAGRCSRNESLLYYVACNLLSFKQVDGSIWGASEHGWPCRFACEWIKPEQPVMDFACFSLTGGVVAASLKQHIESHELEQASRSCIWSCNQCACMITKLVLLKNKESTNKKTPSAGTFFTYFQAGLKISESMHYKVYSQDCCYIHNV